MADTEVAKAASPATEDKGGAAEDPMQVAATEARGVAPPEGTTTEKAPEPEETAPTVASGQEETTAVDADISVEGEKTEEAPVDTTADAPTTPVNGSTASTKKDKTKKKTGGIPEHKGNKLGKKKSLANLQLNVNAGETWWARMKGHPPWPAIICDEDLIPESLLQKRPVSAAGPDGQYREDYREGGKNVKDRRYPVMFLGTNEFAWLPNTDLKPLDMDQVKLDLAEIKNNEAKRKKFTHKLIEAYEVAVEKHDLEYFKQIVNAHTEAMQEEARLQEERAAEKAKKKEKAEKRKSKATAEDTEMPDAPEDSEDGASKNKKRKRESEGGTSAKAPKTPRLKVNGPKATATETPTSKKSKTSKQKKVAKPAEEDDPEGASGHEDTALTAEQRHENLKKTALFLRHKLQKGFVSRDQTPKEEEMAVMAGYFDRAENLPDLDPDILRSTKLHKVFKAIVRLASIPREEEFKFKARSQTLIEKYNKVLGASADKDGEPASATSEKAEVTTNGVDAPKADEAKAESAEPSTDVGADKMEIDEADATKPNGTASADDGEKSPKDTTEPAKSESAPSETPKDEMSAEPQPVVEKPAEASKEEISAD